MAGGERRGGEFERSLLLLIIESHWGNVPPDHRRLESKSFAFALEFRP